jgi:hypothetical protein
MQMKILNLILMDLDLDEVAHIKIKDLSNY